MPCIKHSIRRTAVMQSLHFIRYFQHAIKMAATKPNYHYNMCCVLHLVLHVHFKFSYEELSFIIKQIHNRLDAAAEIYVHHVIVVFL